MARLNLFSWPFGTRTKVAGASWFTAGFDGGPADPNAIAARPRRQCGRLHDPLFRGPDGA